MHYPEAESVLRELKASTTNWTNRTFVGEAVRRGMTVSRNPRGRFVVGDGQGRSFTWSGGITNFNTLLAIRVAAFKDVSSRMLRAHGVEATENAVFDAEDEDRAWNWSEPLGALVVKPFNGAQGRDVRVGVVGRDAFSDAFQDVAGRSGGKVLVEKFYTGVEHRALVIRGKFFAATLRRPASVDADGTSSVRELVHRKNEDRGLIHKAIDIDAEAISVLAEQGLVPDSVPAAASRVFLRRTSNIHRGGDAIDATDMLSADEIDLVERAARAVPGARLLGIDVLLPRSPEHDAARILELNTGPMTSMHHYPWEGTSRNAAGAVLDAMFPASRSDVLSGTAEQS